MESTGSILILIVIISFGLILISYLFSLNLWYKAYSEGVKISLVNILSMRFRRTPPSLIVHSLITAKKAGLELNCMDLEAHYLAGGKPLDIVNALVKAKQANLSVDYRYLTAIDLTGRDVLAAIQTAIYPKKVDIPVFEVHTLDSISVKINAKLTIRSSIRNYIGGADENTLIRRVKEAISSWVSDHNSQDVLKKPGNLVAIIKEMKPDGGTAYELIDLVINIL